MAFDIRIDSKGRIMLPKQIRHLFNKRARIIWEDDRGVIMPLYDHVASVTNSRVETHMKHLCGIEEMSV